MNDIRLITPYN